jgi:hypothetical protein
MQKMVLTFRKQLCIHLLYHPLNRINLVEFRKKLGITLKRKLPGILDLTIEGESSDSKAIVITDTENRYDKIPEDESDGIPHTNDKEDGGNPAEKEQVKIEETGLLTDTRTDNPSFPSDEAEKEQGKIEETGLPTDNP